MDRGVIGSMVRCSSGVWLGGGDCADCAATGELKQLRYPEEAAVVVVAVVLVVGTQPVGPSGKRDVFE
jgi:hypothetical protein